MSRAALHLGVVYNNYVIKNNIIGADSYLSKEARYYKNGLHQQRWIFADKSAIVRPYNTKNYKVVL